MKQIDRSSEGPNVIWFLNNGVDKPYIWGLVTHFFVFFYIIMYQVGSEKGKKEERNGHFPIWSPSSFQSIVSQLLLGNWRMLEPVHCLLHIPLLTSWVDFQLPESPNFKVRVSLDVKQGGGPKSQFYLIDIGSCWKHNGEPCDGDVVTDVTRYSEMIINPATPAWCSPKGLQNCPPYHITPNNTKIHRNDTANFPYSAYHYYCVPETAQYAEKPFSTCDPYSNPQAQELVQLLPHPIWAEYGYPTKQGDGWVGDAKTWELDVGGLSSRLYFYQVSNL